MKIPKRKTSFKILSIIIVIFFNSCGNFNNKNVLNSSYNTLNDWLSKNKNIIKDELITKRKFIQNENINDSNWISQAIVILDEDPSILGEFSKKIKSINDSLYLSYVFYNDSSLKTVIRINKESDCYYDIDTIFNSLKNYNFGFRLNK